MSVTLCFEHDTTFEAHIVRISGSIATFGDCEDWYRAAVEYFVKLPQSSDAIFIVDQLEVAPELALPWARYCAMLRDNFVRHSVCSVNDLVTAIACLRDLRDDKQAYEPLVAA